MNKDLKTIKTCKGCQAILQTEDENKIGYVKDISHNLCLNCFNLKFHNVSDDVVLKTHFPKIPDKSFIVYVVSSLHLNTLFKYDLSNFYPNNKLIVLINKIDLLPKTVNFDLWVERIKEDSKHLNILEVIPISALKGHYLDVFLETLVYYKAKEVYFVGLQNSGKSTLLNRIALKQEDDEVALTAHAPGLTKDNIVYNYHNIKIIDTPGVYERGYVSDYLTYSQYKNTIPNKTFRPVTYQLSNKQSIIVGGIAIISIIKGKKTSFTFYLGDINLHRTKYSNAYEQFEKHKGTLYKPVSDQEYETKHIRLDEDDKYTLNIFDLGYLVVKGPITLEIYSPKGANILVTKGTYHGL